MERIWRHRAYVTAGSKRARRRALQLPYVQVYVQYMPATREIRCHLLHILFAAPRPRLCRGHCGLTPPLVSSDCAVDRGSLFLVCRILPQIPPENVPSCDVCSSP